MASIKPSKSESFVGGRDELTVNIWLYQVETYLNLVHLWNIGIALGVNIRITFSSMLLKGITTNWLYMLVQSGHAAGQLDTFKFAVVKEVIPLDIARQSRDELKNLRQKTSVSSYLNEFRNLVIGMSGIREDEKMDKFCAGFKTSDPFVGFEGRTWECWESYLYCPKCWECIARGRQIFLTSSTSGVLSGPEPMNIGNAEDGSHYRGQSYKERFRTHREWTQSQKNLANNACFVCHKRGCRPWKHKNGRKNAQSSESVEKLVSPPERKFSTPVRSEKKSENAIAHSKPK